MNLELTPQQQQFRDQVRGCARDEVRPAADAAEPNSRFPVDLLPRLSAMGLMGILVPRELGGQGLDTISACLAIRELATACPSVAVTVHVNNFVFCAPLLHHGTVEQQRELLVDAAAGRLLGAFALSESDAGADPSRITTIARLEADGYRVSGGKAWVTNGSLASFFLVVARVERGGRADGTAQFVIDADAPGLRVSKPHRTSGIRSARVVDLEFENVMVPRNRLLGSTNRGLQSALDTLLASRIGVAAQSVGIARGALAQVSDQARNDRAGHQALAGHAAEVEAANLMMLRAAWLVDQGISCPREASMAKLICSEAAVRASAAVLDHLGSEACMDRHPASRFWRDARVTIIYGGPSEIQRGLIARQLQ